jgi:hypothetical protein
VTANFLNLNKPVVDLDTLRIDDLRSRISTRVENVGRVIASSFRDGVWQSGTRIYGSEPGMVQQVKEAEKLAINTHKTSTSP